MAGAGHVGVDAAVGAVGAAAHLGGPVHLDVVHHQVVHVQSLEVGVGFGVAQQLQQVLARLLGPAALGGAERLGLDGVGGTVTECRRYEDTVG